MSKNLNGCSDLVTLLELRIMERFYCDLSRITKSHFHLKHVIFVNLYEQQDEEKQFAEKIFFTIYMCSVYVWHA